MYNNACTTYLYTYRVRFICTYTLFIVVNRVNRDHVGECAPWCALFILHCRYIVCCILTANQTMSINAIWHKSFSLNVLRTIIFSFLKASCVRMCNICDVFARNTSFHRSCTLRTYNSICTARLITRSISFALIQICVHHVHVWRYHQISCLCIIMYICHLCNIM